MYILLILGIIVCNWKSFLLSFFFCFCLDIRFLDVIDFWCFLLIDFFLVVFEELVGNFIVFFLGEFVREFF